MSQPGELHTLGITRRVWQRVPTMMGFPQETRAVMGFWRHEVEGQKRADNGEKLSEVMRDPKCIVYTPAGFVGVHFPTRTRTRFVAGEPTDAEARQDGNYLGYYAALGLYPGGRHQGLIFQQHPWRQHDDRDHAAPLLRSRGRSGSPDLPPDPEPPGD